MKTISTGLGEVPRQKSPFAENKVDACGRAGVLCKSQITELFDKGIAQGGPTGKPDMKLHDSAFDLHLGRECYELLGTTKLKKNEVVKSQLSNRFIRGRFDLKDLVRLEKGRTYLVKLQEVLDLSRHPELHGRATGKSSIGRVDVLCHLMVNGEPSYDCVGSGYHGELYIQITPLTFPVLVKEGYCLNQLRMFCGRPELSEISDGARVFERNLLMLDTVTPATDAIAGGFLRLSLAPILVLGEKAFAFAAKEDVSALEPLDLGKKGFYDPCDYWDLVKKDRDYIRAEKDRFHIVRSLERLRLPEDVAVDCIAMSENLGDLRIHYAGFAHPTFGSLRPDGRGTPLMFEVRCFTEQVLRHEEQLAKIKFYRMARAESEAPPSAEPSSDSEKTSDAQSKDMQPMAPSERNSDYEEQELQLSNIFRSWPST